MTRSMGKITVVRRVVQGCMLVLFCLPPLLAGWGLAGLFAGGDGEVATPAEGVFFGSLSSSSVAGVPLFDPLGAMEAMAASRSMLAASALTGALLVVVVYGLVRGRAFCGWVCPVNLIGEGVDAARRRLGIEVPERTVPRRAKIGVAVAVVLLSALVGFPVFELISPIGAVNKGLVFGGFAGAGTLLAIIIAELLVSRRLWCRALCPLGGTFQVLGRAGPGERRHRSRRLHPLRQVHPRLPRRSRDPRAGAGGGGYDRACRRLHGLWRLRGRVPHFRPALPLWAPPPFPKGYRKRIGEKSQRR